MHDSHKIARLKGVRDGIRLTLDPHQSLSILLPEVTELFQQMQHLAADATVWVETDGGALDTKTLEQLETTLEKEFAIGSLRPLPEKAGDERSPARGAGGRLANLGRTFNPHRNDGLFLAGRVRSGQNIKARKHLVIMGDVNPGAEIEAGGDILILGTLGGKASAGIPDNTGAIILALDLRPTQLQIGGIVAAGQPGTKGHGIEYARVENGAIIVSDFKKDNPFKQIQWPEQR